MIMKEEIERISLWFDDIRRPPAQHWSWARTIDEAKLMVNSHNVVEASLDHDLGLEGYDPDEQDADLRRVPSKYRCYHCDAISWERGLNVPPDHCTGCGADSGALTKVEVPDGVAFAKWRVEIGKVPPLVVLHSMNPIGAENMRKVLEHHAQILIVKSYECWQ
jgi:hypothetical protein